MDVLRNEFGLEEEECEESREERGERKRVEKEVEVVKRKEMLESRERIADYWKHKRRMEKARKESEADPHSKKIRGIYHLS